MSWIPGARFHHDDRDERARVNLQLLLTLLLAGIAALDATPVAQTLMSQPLITATLVGLLWGQWVLALKVGIVLQLFAAADALREKSGTPMTPDEQVYFDEQLKVLGDKLDKTQFDSIWSKGCTMTMEQAIEFALENSDG